MFRFFVADARQFLSRLYRRLINYVLEDLNFPHEKQFLMCDSNDRVVTNKYLKIWVRLTWAHLGANGEEEKKFSLLLWIWVRTSQFIFQPKKQRKGGTKFSLLEDFRVVSWFYYFLFLSTVNTEERENVICATRLNCTIIILILCFVFRGFRSSSCYYVFKTEDSSIIINIKSSNFRCKHELSRELTLSSVCDISIFLHFSSSIHSSHDNHKSLRVSLEAYTWKWEPQFKPKQVFASLPIMIIIINIIIILLRTACIFPLWFPPHYCLLVTEWIFKLNYVSKTWKLYPSETFAHCSFFIFLFFPSAWTLWKIFP